MDFWRLHRRLMASFALFALLYPPLLQAAGLGIDLVRTSPQSMQVNSSAALPAEVQAMESATLSQLFDRDTTTEYSAFDNQSVDVTLPESRKVTALRVYGAAPYVLTVQESTNGGWRDIQGLKGLDLTQLPATWNTFSTNKAVTTQKLRLVLTQAASSAAGLKEVEFWSEGEHIPVETGSQLLALLGDDDMQDQALLATATPANGLIGSIGEQDLDDPSDNTFSLNLNIPASQIKYAWLVYDTFGVSHWANAVRVINDQPALGGVVVEGNDAWSEQIERISPLWLKQGANRIRFAAPTDNPYQYKVRNVRLVVELDNGANFVNYIGASSTDDSAAIDRLYDGDQDTGVVVYSGDAIGTVTADSSSDVTLPPGLINNPGNGLHLGWVKGKAPWKQALQGDPAAKGATTLEMGFDRGVELEAVGFYLRGKLAGKIDVQLFHDGNWQPSGSRSVAAKSLKTGWNDIPVAAGNKVQGVRLVFTGGEGSGGEIRELTVRGSGIGGAWLPPEVVVTYPDAGQYYGRQAYVRGFLQGLRNASGDAQLFIGGRPLNHVNGEFQTLISKEDLGLTSQADDVAWSVDVEAVYPDGSRTTTQVPLFDNHGPLEEASPDSDVPAVDYVPVTPEEGASNEFEGAGIDVAPGAVPANLNISMMPLRDIDLASLDTWMTNVTGPHNGYRFLPHGKHFKKKIEVRIKYQPSLLPPGFSEDDIKTFYFDDQAGKWKELERKTIDKGKKEVVALTDHFTDMINAVIQVPDSPQNTQFNPTQIKDIKAADPGAKVNLIEPPQANNMGDARLSYPIEVPPGRHGMQPQLAVQYNSGGGHSWMGQGWDISTQAITIDTRWGVPRYNPDNESETYLLNGEQLLPLIHREDTIPRTANKQFHPRVEGAFQRIIRHGDSPKDYWWEVTDKSGTTYFYGGDDVSKAASPDATLTTAKGEIGKWALVLVRDSNGNEMRYHYTNQKDAGLGNGTGNVQGQQVYLSRITYTGYNGQEGNFEVEFLRDRQMPGFNRNEDRRTDVNIDARLGLKQVTADLLKRINVKYNNNAVRSYTFDYREGAYGKTLLSSVSQRDNKGQIFNTHTFDYFDEVRDAQKRYVGYVNAPWTMPSDGVRGGLYAGKGDISVLGGGFSSGRGEHLYAGIGFGFTPTKSGSLGVKVGSNQSESNGQMMLVDMNGDGLPDKVFKRGGVYYRPNLSGPDGAPMFGTPIPVGIGNFSEDKTTMRSKGAEVYLSGAMAGYNRSKTSSTGLTYVSDVNGDGLIDVVDKGIVRFNLPTLDADGNHTGGVNFSANSSATPNPVGSGSVDANELFESFAADYEEAIDFAPLHDSVRRWKVPFDGIVDVRGVVKLTTTEQIVAKNYQTADGVRVAIQLNGDELWSENIPRDSDAAVVPRGVKHVAVEKGDDLYFRVQSINDGAFDRVAWSPVIQYVQAVPVETDVSGEEVDASGSQGSQVETQWQDMAEEDSSGRNLYRYSAKDDFVTTGSIHAQTTMPEKGRVRITGDFHKLEAVTDDIRVRILRKNTVLLDKTLSWDKPGNVEIDFETDVARLDRLTFELSTDSRIDLKKVRWEPKVTYVSLPSVEVGMDENGDPINLTDVVDENGQPLSLSEMRDPDGNLLFVVSPVIDSDVYSRFENVAPIQPWLATQEGVVTVIPSVQTDGIAIGERRLFLTVKSEGELLTKQDIQVVVEENPITGEAKYTLIPEEFSFPVAFSEERLDRTYHFEFFTRNPALASHIEVAAAQITYDGSKPADDKPDNREKVTVNTGLFTQNQDLLYGREYRGWSYFAYNGNRERALYPIEESLLVMPDIDPDDIPKPGDSVDQESPLDISTLTAIPFIPEPDKRRWKGLDNKSWISADNASSSRLGEDYIEVPRVENFAGRRAVQRLSVTKNEAYSAGFIAGASKSDARVRSIVDFMDMNGDRYPDVLASSRVQFTSPDGGLEGSNKSVALGDVRASDSVSESLGISGNFASVAGSVTGKDSKIAQQMPPLGFGGNVSRGGSKPDFDLRDINGDGLPDRVHDGGGVSLNLGYGFAPSEPWPAYALGDSSSDGKSLSLSYNIDSFSFGAGVNVSDTENVSDDGLVDVNGDGLPDRVKTDNGTLFVGFNTGNGFMPSVAWSSARWVSQSRNVDQGAGVYVTFPIPILPPPFPTAFTILTNPGSDWSKSVSSTEVAFNDINGDGYPDYLKSRKDGDLSVQLNTHGRTNLLKSVQRPLGGSFEVDYERVGNTYKMPQSKWVLSSVTVHDGFAGDGVDTQLSTFHYEDGYYDRRERDFFGFASVVVEERKAQAPQQPVYRSVTQHYLNGSLYQRGLLISTRMTDGQGKPYTSSNKRYQFKNVTSGAVYDQGADLSQTSARLFPQLIDEQSFFHEGEEVARKSTRQRYLAYDDYGNVTDFIDYGDSGDDDNVKAHIAYAYDKSAWIMGAPKSIKVYDSSDRLLRKRTSSIEAGTGNVRDVRQHYEGGVARYDFDYDRYGNLEIVTGPANANGQRYEMTYRYDDAVHTYVVWLKDSFGYISGARYDAAWGQMLESTDINNQKVTTTYDSVGRVHTITGPYEQGTGKATITFDYFPKATPGALSNASLNWARTRHYDPEHPGDPIETVLFTDGLKRVLQTKKDGAIGTGEGGADGEASDVMIASGRIVFDHAGRTKKQYYPVTEPLGQAGLFNPAFDTQLPTVTNYDVLDRPLKVTIPDGTSTTFKYGFGTDRDGHTQFRTRVTDANGISKDSFRDVRQLITAVKEYNNGGSETLWTSYAYDPLKQITDVWDAQHNHTTATYDQLGRRTALTNPDTGKVTMVFDAAGNLTRKVTPNLRAKGQAITYQYDYTRLAGISYPEFTGNNIAYEYGGINAPHNGANRIIKTTDQAGYETRQYGPLGELTQSTRSIKWAAGPEEAYTTTYKYDTWNRLQQLIYPDGEVLTYDYNSGGLMAAVQGKKGSYDYPYVQRLDYDKFEQRSYLLYGNNTETRYTYNQANRRLSHLTAGKGDGNLFMDLSYGYDNVGNILSQGNAATVNSPAQMGGKTSFTYSYDDLYRLTDSTGTFDTQPDKQHAYTLSMRYDNIHNITGKTQQHTLRQPSGQRVTQKKTTYDWSDSNKGQGYKYDGTQPHAPTHIGERAFSYDANGNQLGWTHDKNGTRRTITWDEENRIQQIHDNGHTLSYTYDASGQRISKRGPQGETGYINQWMTLRNGEVGTKHVFVGTTRVVSKLVKQDKPNTKRNSENNPNSKGNGQGKARIVYEKDQYYFHPDHLGTTSYITHTNGQVYQHLEYFPFGETWVEEHSNKQRTPYQFTAKELDEETGLYYFGARYYDPRTSVWGSVDPILGKYLGVVPERLAGLGGVFNSRTLGLYGYVYNNPLKLVDPDGNEAKVVNNMIHIVPKGEKASAPNVTIPNTVGAKGFSNNSYTYHEYNYTHDAASNNPGKVGDAIASNPTPGNSNKASASGTLNEVGRIDPLDGGDNYVRSFLVPSPDPSKYTDVTVNYTVEGEHAVEEGYVMKWGDISEDGSIKLRTYGEGDSWKQIDLLEPIWRDKLDDTWNTNHEEINEALRNAE